MTITRLIKVGKESGTDIHFEEQNQTNKKELNRAHLLFRK